MSEPTAHWGKLDRARTAPSVASDSEAEIFAECLTSAAGKEMLEILRSRTIERRLSPNASDAELRWAEAQRNLVATMESDRDKGLEIMARRAKAEG